MEKRVLLVEDDADIVELLTIHLEDLRCAVVAVDNGPQGLDTALREPFDLIVLDVGLPGMDGMEVTRKLRGKENFTPVLMLTARSEEIDKVIGLEMGADDYLTKPFSIREFIARVRVIFRRKDRNEGENRRPGSTDRAVFRHGQLTIDLHKRRVRIGGKRVELSPKEFDLLCLLASEPGKCYDRSSLLNLVWGYDFDGYEHTVNSHINRLRAKIEPDAQHPIYILTNWGVGYRFNEELAESGG